YFIVGPNGAGKSTFTEALVSEQTVILNGDEIRRLFPSLNQAAAHFNTALSEAAEHRQSVSVESNFLDPYERRIYLPFKDLGYHMNLVFFGLNDINESFARVALRKMQGGHAVPKETIELNFKHSLRNAL